MYQPFMVRLLTVEVQLDRIEHAQVLPALVHLAEIAVTLGDEARKAVRILVWRAERASRITASQGVEALWVLDGFTRR